MAVDRESFEKTGQHSHIVVYIPDNNIGQEPWKQPPRRVISDTVLKRDPRLIYQTAHREYQRLVRQYIDEGYTVEKTGKVGASGWHIYSTLTGVAAAVLLWDGHRSHVVQLMNERHYTGQPCEVVEAT